MEKVNINLEWLLLKRQNGDESSKPPIVIHQVTANQAKNPHIQQKLTKFDTNSDQIGIDNRCSACISHVAEDFDFLEDTNWVIKGIGGHQIHNIKKGTLQWKVEDDKGRGHEWKIKDSLYVPEAGLQPLCPQHWSQMNKSLKTDETTDNEKCTLQWGHGKYTLTAPLGEVDNCGYT